MNRYLTLIAAVVALFALSAPAPAAAAEPRELVGALHEHSGYSDGWPGSRPADYYASARDRNDLHFLGSSEHETNLAVPFVLNEECAENPSICLIADPVNPADSFRKWPAIAEQAAAATDPAKDFTGFRGFEWSSDRSGHINVYFSAEYTQSTVDGSAATVDAFYDWLVRPAMLGGGSDGLATFNHPGDKSACGQLGACAPEDDPAFNWDDFRYVPQVDPQMVGIEVFNGNRDYGSAPGHNAPPEGWYARALDRGWHVGAIGAEDKGHDRPDNWGAAEHAKTVIFAEENTTVSIREAMRRRSFYAVQDNALRLRFSIDGEPMGSRLARVDGRALDIRAEATGSAPVTLELLTSGGKVVASGEDRLSVTRPAGSAERWYFVRARRDGKSVGYSSPVWIEPAAVSGVPAAGPGSGPGPGPGPNPAAGLPSGPSSVATPESSKGKLLASLTTARRRTRGVLLRFAGVAFRARCSRSCRLEATVRTVGRSPKRLGVASSVLPAPRARRIRVPLGRSAVAAGLGSRARTKLVLRVSVTDQGGRTEVARRTIVVDR